MRATTKPKFFTEAHGTEVVEIVEAIFQQHKELTEAIFIDAPVMCGKSTFVKSCLCEYARKHNHKILMLVPRKPIKKQFDKEIFDSDNEDIVRVETYQKFEKRSTKAIDEITGVFDVIVCDEAHYFVSDSTYNRHTDRSLYRILGQQAVKIFMTATPNPVLKVVDAALKEFEPTAKMDIIRAEGRNILKDVKFFADDSMLGTLQGINEILDDLDKTDEKAIIFCYSAEMARDLYLQRVEQSMYVCSESNEDYAEYMDLTKRDIMLETERFDCKYLFTTSAMEMGVTIKDEKLKHIICTLKDWNSILQAKGRKRPVDGAADDTFLLWLNNRDGYAIQGALTRNAEALKHYNYLTAYGEEEYMAQFLKDEDKFHVVYFDKGDNTTEGNFHPKIDNMILTKLQHERELLKQIQGLPYGNANYKAWVYNEFQLTPYQKRKTYAIYKRLEALIGQTFGKKQYRVIVEAINLRRNRNNTDKGANNTLIRDMNTLNEYLAEIGVDMVIKCQQDKKTRRMIYWIERTSDAINGKSNATAEAKGA